MKKFFSINEYSVEIIYIEEELEEKYLEKFKE